MPAKQSVSADAGDSSGEDEINLNKVVETKKELDKIRKERDRKRAQAQADLDKKLDGLRARIQQSVKAHTQQLGDMHQQNVDRLLPAIEARNAIMRAISEKLTEIQTAGEEIATYLDGAYEHRLKKAESSAGFAEDQTGPQGNKVKAGAA